MAGIESRATADQTGNEIVALINDALGQMGWQLGGTALERVQFLGTGEVRFFTASGTVTASMLTAVQTIIAALVFQDSQIPDSIARDSEVANLYAALAGATFTGPVRGIAPVAANDFTTKPYVDQQIARATGGSTPVMTHPGAYICLLYTSPSPRDS